MFVRWLDLLEHALQTRTAQELRVRYLRGHSETGTVASLGQRGEVD